MKKQISLLVLFLGAAGALHAASTGIAALHMPQGSGSTAAQGDFVSSADVGMLNTSYHYWVEVTPGLARLRVRFYDPDWGLGNGLGGEDLAGRDRFRASNAPANVSNYTLFNPRGQQRNTVFNTGNVTTPAASDATFLTFYDSTGDTVRDNFNAVAYTNNDGTMNWGTNWAETNDDNNAGAGLMQITGNLLRIRDNGNAANSMIDRQVDLTGFTTATLTYDFTSANAPAGSTFIVQASSNGGAAYTTIRTYTFPVANGTESLNLTPYIAANTRIRFATVGATWTGVNNAQFTLGNLQIKDSAVIEPGHWEIRINQNNTVGTGNGINALGISADDGDGTSAGTELNTYADSMISIGANAPNAGTLSRTYTLYPWVSAGCACRENDYDYDSDAGNTGSMTFTSRSGTFTQTFTSASLSTDSAWCNAGNGNSMTGFVTDSLADDYGIWTMSATITSYINGLGQNGNYSTVYIGSNATPAAPPAANPIANNAAFRIYLPTDAGAAPVKPYMQQQLTQRFSGTLQVGSPQKFTVTIFVSNPTPHDITFSNTNRVAARVPGGTVNYAGNAQASQGAGTIVAPATMATFGVCPGTCSGDITWNPGIIAAGQNALFSYDVWVAPTAAGQRNLVTGPSTNTATGTRATYVDETGNTTQARATYRLGPICELAATQGLATEVMVSSFDANVRGSKTVVEWKTASEVGTIGFNVYRVNRSNGAQTKVNTAALPASIGSPQGGRYRLIDRLNSDPQPAYILEELTTSGHKNLYGPYYTKGMGTAEAPANGDFERTPKKAAAAPVKRPGSSPRGKITAMIFGVPSTGIVRLTAADLSAQLGKNVNAVTGSIKRGGVSITNMGRQVAYAPQGDGESLLFFGEKSDSIYSTDRAYRISLDAGTLMDTKNVSASSGPVTSFPGSKELEVDSFPATVVRLDPESDYWFWDAVIPGYAPDDVKTFNVNIPSVASASSVTLQVRLQGAISGNSHRAKIRMNGVPIGETTFTGLSGSVYEINVPAAVLRDGANSIEVQGTLEGSASSDVFYVDGFTVRYPRFATPEAGTVEVNTTAGSGVTAGPFTTAPIILDVTDRLRPALVKGAAASGPNVSFIAPSAKLFFSESSAVITPSWSRGSTDPALRSKQRADYVVIAPAALRTSADALAQLRQNDGLTAMSVDLEQIYDEFGGGNTNPHAIQDFISATRSWTLAPKYFALAGGGNVDYRGINSDPGLIPPLMAKTANGLSAADSLFGDFNGDGLPEVAIGRIPISNATELDAYVRKLDNSARSSVANKSILFTADAVDRGADFRSASQRIEKPLATRSATRIYLDATPLDAARTSLFSAWQNGTPLVSFIGHGGFDMIASTGLLSVDDMPSLTSAGTVPVVVAMTCTINRFEIGPTFDALGPVLTRSPNGGAAAVWSSSGLSIYSDATDIEDTFMRLAAKQPGSRVGDLVVKSLAENRDIVANNDTPTTYLLLGDPAIRVSLPAENQKPVSSRNVRE